MWSKVLGGLCFLLTSSLLAEPLHWVKVPAEGTVLNVTRNVRGGGSVTGSTRYEELITEVASAHQLDPLLVQAVVAVESDYRHDVVSDKGAIGLMQLMPVTAARYGKHDLTEPRENLEVGAAYLGELLLRFGRLDLALAGYNAGEGAVDRYGGHIPPYPETQHYVERVLDYYKSLKYQALNESSPSSSLSYGDTGKIWSLLIGGS